MRDRAVVAVRRPRELVTRDATDRDAEASMVLHEGRQLRFTPRF
jgi:hypothetical protein